MLQTLIKNSVSSEDLLTLSKLESTEADDENANGAARENIDKAQEEFHDENKWRWKTVHRITRKDEWARLTNSTIPLRVVLVGKDYNKWKDRFEKLHAGVMKSCPGMAIFAHMPRFTAEETIFPKKEVESVKDEIVLLKQTFVAQRLPLSDDVWNTKLDVESLKAVCARACLVVVGHSFSEKERKIFLEDIELAFKEHTSLDPSSAAKAIKDAKECDLPGLFEVFPVESTDKTNNWNHLLFSIDPSSEEVREHIKYVLENPYIGWLYIVYCGHGSEEGDWILHDCDFTSDMFMDVIAESLESRKKSANGRQVEFTGQVIFNCCYGGMWTEEMWKDKGLQEDYLFERMRPEGEKKPIHLDGMYRPAELGELGSAVADVSLFRAREKVTPPPKSAPFRILPKEPTVFVFPAEDGDCSLFACDDFCVLVDGGRPANPCCWNYVATLSKIDAAVVTHIDADHITGMIGLLETLKVHKEEKAGGLVSQPRPIGELYFNCPEEEKQLKKETSEYRGVKQGRELLGAWRELCGGKATPKPCFRGDFVRDNDAISVQVVTPFDPEKFPSIRIPGKITEREREIKFLKEKWPEEGENIPSLGTGVRRTEPTKVKKRTKGTTGTEAKISVTNMVSVSLLITMKSDPQHRVLYCGDSPKNRLLEGLEELDEKFKQDGIDVDVLWVPHHGSKNNTDQQFFKKVRASVYIFSSDGSRQGHPDKEIIEDLIKAYEKWPEEARARHPKITLFPNYLTEKPIERSTGKKPKTKNFESWMGHKFPKVFSIAQPISGFSLAKAKDKENPRIMKDQHRDFHWAQVNMLSGTITYHAEEIVRYK